MSNIIFNTIDESYPLAGQDNDSQGFRDNFSILKAGLATANSEITVLENTTVKFADGAGDPVTNDLAASILSNGQLDRTYKTSYNNGSVLPGTTEVSFESGAYHKVQVTGTTTFALANWPQVENTYSKMTFEISSANELVQYTISFSSNGSTTINTNWSGDLLTELAPSGGLSVIVVDAWTADGGATVFIHKSVDDASIALANYVTTTDLSTSLSDYVTTTELSTSLTNYATTTDLSTSLTNYATTTDLSTALTGTLEPAEILLPSYSDIQRDIPGTFNVLGNGTIIYNSTSLSYEVYDEGSWKKLVPIEDVVAALPGTGSGATVDDIIAALQGLV